MAINCEWHTNKDYWPNETSLGQLIAAPATCLKPDED